MSCGLTDTLDIFKVCIGPVFQMLTHHAYKQYYMDRAGSN